VVIYGKLDFAVLAIGLVLLVQLLMNLEFAFVCIFWSASYKC
jgi:hypothetical protein